MTKELSKKLCEIVGLEPKNSDCGNCKYFKTDTSACLYEVDENGYGCFQRYPDFGEPENFVKLFQLMYSQGNIGGNLGEGGYYLTNTIISEDADSCTPENYMNTLCYILCDESHNIALYDGEIDDIKQAICEAEWKYE